MGAYFLNKDNQHDIFLRAQRARRLITNYFDSLYQDTDLLLFPSAPAIPHFIDQEFPKRYDYMSYILSAANLSGSPSLTMRLGEHDGIPFNVTLETSRCQDGRLLSYAMWIEEQLSNE